MTGSDADLFTDAQRRTIGLCLSQLTELVGTVRSYGASPGHLDRIDEAIAAMATATGAWRPPPPRSMLNASLAQMLVLEEELRPRRLKGYGAVGDDTARLLDEHVRGLVEATNDLIASIEQHAAEDLRHRRMTE